jgi:hypothetical protein
MRKEQYFMKGAGLGLALVFLFVFSCGGGMGGGGANEPVRTGKAKYDNFFEKAEKYEAEIKEAKATIEQAQADLAVAVGLSADADLSAIKDAIRTAIETAVVKAGGHVEVTIEGGIFASGGAALDSSGASAGGAVSADITVTIEVVGDVEASVEVQKIIDAAKVSITASAEVATRLKPITLELPDLVAEAGELQASVASDFDPIMAAKVTARLTGLTDILKQVTGLFDTSFNFSIEVKASFSMEASAEAEASGSAEAGTE